MKESLVVCAYWEDSKKSPDDCANTITAFLKNLGERHTIFCSWFLPAHSLVASMEKRISISKESIRKSIETESDEKLGFSFMVWNGELGSERESQVRIRCGIHAGVMGVMNSCVLKLPIMDISKSNIFSFEQLKELFVLTIKTWDPGWAVLTSYELREVVFSRGKPVSRQPYPGYFLYLPIERGEIPTLPNPAQVVPIEGKGNLIITVNNSFKTVAEYDGWITDISDILKSNNLLEPMKLSRL